MDWEDCFTECDDVASNMKAPNFATFDEASAYVRRLMPDENMVVIDNIAESLFYKRDNGG